MLHATMRSLLARKLRLAMCAFAIVLGVAFVAGSFVFTDTLGSSFDSLVKGTTGEVVVEVADAGDPTDPEGGGDARTIPGDVVDELSQVPGAARVDGNLTVGNVFVVGPDGKAVGGNGPPSFAVGYTMHPRLPVNRHSGSSREKSRRGRTRLRSTRAPPTEPATRSEMRSRW